MSRIKILGILTLENVAIETTNCGDRREMKSNVELMERKHTFLF